MNRPERKSWKNVDAAFDGHLEKPLSRMSVEERLLWLEEGARLLRWAREVRAESGLEPARSIGTNSPAAKPPQAGPTQPP